MTRMSNLFYSEMDSLLGPITVARTKKGLCWIDYSQGESAIQALQRWSRKYFLTGQIKRDDVALADVLEQLDEYFQQRRQVFDIELDLIGTSFQKLVWNQLCCIPYGEVRSYKEVAQAIGAPKAIRAIGGANNKNNIPIVVPCHRVIGSNGALVGYSSGVHIKKHLLELEGYPLAIHQDKK